MNSRLISLQIKRNKNGGKNVGIKEHVEKEWKVNKRELELVANNDG